MRPPCSSCARPFLLFISRPPTHNCFTAAAAAWLEADHTPTARVAAPPAGGGLHLLLAEEDCQARPDVRTRQWLQGRSGCCASWSSPFHHRHAHDDQPRTYAKDDVKVPIIIYL